MSEDLSLRDRIRKATLGTPDARKSVVVEWNGERLEVRKLTFAQQKKINKLCTRTITALDSQTGQRVASEKLDEIRMAVLTVIHCCYVPGTDERIFDDKDEQEISSMAVEGFLAEVFDAVGEVNKKPKEPEPGEEPEPLKNSARTSAASSSS